MSSNSLSEAVTLPQNSADWKKMAEETKIPSTGAQPQNQDDQNLPGPSPTFNHPPEYHVGEKVSELSLRQVDGWPSASQMTRGHYLLTRALWKFHHAKDLSSKLGYYSKESKKYAMEALEHDKQWEEYKRDIGENAGRDNDDKIDVGKFTSTRSFQLRVSNEIPTDPHEVNQSPERPKSPEPPKSAEGATSSEPPKSAEGATSSEPPKSAEGATLSEPPKSAEGATLSEPPKSAKAEGATLSEPPKSAEGATSSEPPKLAKGATSSEPSKSAEGAILSEPPKLAEGATSSEPPKSAEGATSSEPPKSAEGAIFTRTRSKTKKVPPQTATAGNSSGAIFTRTRSKTKKVPPQTATAGNSSAAETMPNAETQSNDPGNDADSARQARSASNVTAGVLSTAGAISTAGALSVFSAAHPESAKLVFARTKDEETVNMALVNFLDVLSYYCKEARKVRWDPDRQNLTFQLGKATIVAKSDGRLSKRQAPRDNQNFAIVEVKPFILRENLEKTLMQMGVEMVAWIGQSIDQDTEVPQYILISQHRHEVFLTFAKPGDGYKTYLDKHGPLSMTPEKSGFLELHCFGPFDIFDARHIQILGLVLALLEWPDFLQLCSSFLRTFPSVIRSRLTGSYWTQPLESFPWIAGAEGIFILQKFDTNFKTVPDTIQWLTVLGDLCVKDCGDAPGKAFWWYRRNAPKDGEGRSPPMPWLFKKDEDPSNRQYTQLDPHDAYFIDDDDRRYRLVEASRIEKDTQYRLVAHVFDPSRRHRAWYTPAQTKTLQHSFFVHIKLQAEDGETEVNVPQLAEMTEVKFEVAVEGRTYLKTDLNQKGVVVETHSSGDLVLLVKGHIPQHRGEVEIVTFVKPNTMPIDEQIDALGEVSRFLLAHGVELDPASEFYFVLDARKMSKLSSQLQDERIAYIEEIFPLDEAQQRAFSESTFEITCGVNLIQGPPGTGKTRTAMVIILMLMALNLKVLLVAGSNKGVDNLAESVVAALNEHPRLRQWCGQFIRFRTPTYQLAQVRIDSVNSNRVRLGALGKEGSANRILEPVQMHNVVQRYAEENAESDRDCRKFLDMVSMDKVSHLGKNSSKELRNAYEKCVMSVLQRSKVVATTLSNASQELLRHSGFEPDFVISDEAGQCLEGDHCIALTMPAILDLFNRKVYGGKLKVGPSNDAPERVGNAWDAFTRSRHYFRGFGVAGVRRLFISTLGYADRHENSLSSYNAAQVHALRNLLSQLYQFQTAEGERIKPKDVMIISPYRDQRALVDEVLGQHNIGFNENLTVDAAQGSESPVVVFLMTKPSRDATSVGFVGDRNRLNVALSRAQKVLIVIGNLLVWNSEATKQIQNTTGNRNRFLLDLLWDVTQKRHTLTWDGAKTVEELDPNPHTEKIYEAHDRDIPRPPTRVAGPAVAATAGSQPQMATPSIPRPRVSLPQCDAYRQPLQPLPPPSSLPRLSAAPRQDEGEAAEDMEDMEDFTEQGTSNHGSEPRESAQSVLQLSRQRERSHSPPSPVHQNSSIERGYRDRISPQRDVATRAASYDEGDEAQALRHQYDEARLRMLSTREEQLRAQEERFLAQEERFRAKEARLRVQEERQTMEALLLEQRLRALERDRPRR
ncbi:hypothetical protein CDV55_109139 [Aspergillus turcosus]|uniref:DNA2/NAM7 helicase-like C-terminal domain-containing protein n=1 Tax=Aspergillus turcosus TaxID=1245748 RepID=A0A397IGB4_9EURO|nr:hypothetical protein CDV55_109139 [Aspergillus turcosus]RLM01364.1 hypothetical protein CFD26_108999 [Aspergillus turcosus]